VDKHELAPGMIHVCLLGDPRKLTPQTTLLYDRREHLTKELQAWNKSIQAKAKEGKLDLDMDPVGLPVM
jgi:hypothetical protein